VGFGLWDEFSGLGSMNFEMGGGIPSVGFRRRRRGGLVLCMGEGYGVGDDDERVMSCWLRSAATSAT